VSRNIRPFGLLKCKGEGHIKNTNLKGDHMDFEPEIIMENLSKELTGAIKAMAKAKTVEEKVAYSHIVKNMSESLGVFFSVANDMMALEDFDNDDDVEF